MKKKPFKSLRTSFIAWFLGSTTGLIVYVLLAINIHDLHNGMYILGVLFVMLSAAQFIVFYKFTNSISYISSKMRSTSLGNLSEKVSGWDRNDEIGELVRSYNDLVGRIGEGVKRERQFIADMAHGLKTPIAVMKTSFEITLSRKRKSEEYSQVLQEAMVEITRLTNILEHVLDLARLEAPLKNKEGKNLNLSQLLEEIEDIAQKLALTKKIEVKASIAKNITIWGYKYKLARAIWNIIDNAIKYTSPKGKVEIILGKNAEQAVVTISDNGQGIDKEDLPYIFDRFYRGSVKGKALGSGLGLAIAEAVVQLHQGSLKVKSKLGQGSTFVMTLPLKANKITSS